MLTATAVAPKTLPFLHLHRRRRRPPFFSAASAAAMSAGTVEHLVLFAVKPAAAPPDAMISHLRSLTSLDQVQHLTAGPLSALRSAAGPAFTHLLHSRYRSKPDLADYANHPSHLAVVKAHVLPNCDDIMAVDWLADLGPAPPAPPRPGSVMRVTLIKPKEGVGEEGRKEILRVVGGVKDLVPGLIEQLSCGENFSPARSKGFDLACIAVFPGPKEVEGLAAEGERVEGEKEKVRHLLDGVIVLDYVVPEPSSSSL